MMFLCLTKTVRNLFVVNFLLTEDKKNVIISIVITLCIKLILCTISVGEISERLSSSIIFRSVGQILLFDNTTSLSNKAKQKEDEDEDEDEDEELIFKTKADVNVFN